MNKHDTVIGYIEYLDCNGCVRERIPIFSSCRQKAFVMEKNLSS